MKGSIARIAAALLLAAAIAQPPLAQQVGVNSVPGYAVQFLAGLGGNHSRGNSINDDGWVAGYSHLDAAYRHATLWRDGVPLDLGVLGSKNKPKNSNVAWPVKNTQGVLVGISQTDAPDPYGEAWSCSAFFPPATATGLRCLGFVWENGKMKALPTLGGTHGYAAAANNAGHIVGWAENTIVDPTCTPPQIFQFQAVVWGPQGKDIHPLPSLQGDSSSAATAINDRGQIVGISGACDDAIGSATAAHAVLWESGGVTELPNLGGAEWNTPTAINEHGDVAGFGDHPGDLVTEAFLWTPEGGLQGLGFLYPDHTLSEAFGINDRRQVVGLSCGETECRAFLWQDGAMYDLNQLAGVPAGQLLTHAMDIDNQGVITGRASLAASNERVAYVASPSAAAAVSTQRHLSMRLRPDVLGSVLHPLGPGPERLAQRRSR